MSFFDLVVLVVVVFYLYSPEEVCIVAIIRPLYFFRLDNVIDS